MRKTSGLFRLSAILMLALVAGDARPQMRRMREFVGPDRYVPPPAPQPAPPPSGPENYLSPAALVATRDGRTLFVACATANRVLVVDVADGKVVREIQTPSPPTGLALSGDGKELIVTCAGPRSVAVFAEIDSGRIVHSIRAGHTSNTPVLSPDGRMLFVCNRFTDDVSFIEVTAAREVRRVKVQREPVGAAVTKDGRYLLVANHLNTSPSDANEVAACVSVIDVAAGRVTRELHLPNGSGLLQDLRIAPDGRYACVTHLIHRHQLPTTQLDRGWMNTNALTVIDVEKMETVNTVLLDGIGRGAANPWGLAWSADGKTLIVTHTGTHELTVIDFPALLARLAERKAQDRLFNPQSEIRNPQSPAPSSEVPNELSFLVGLSRRIPLPESDRGPRAVVLVGTKAYTANYFSDTLAVVDLARARPQVQSIALGPRPQMSLARRGEFYFHDATICFQGWQSCSSCHPGDARSDALNWDLLNDGIGNLKNARSLLNAHRISPSMSMGVRATAEVAIRAGISHILGIVQPDEVPQAIYAYVCSLKPVPSPHLVDGRLSESAQRGEQLFNDIDVGCATCHAFDLHTDQRRHEVGTRGRFDAPRDRFYTPTLVELWRTAPYLHDGSAATVRDVLTTKNQGDRHGRTSHLTQEQLDDLAEYLLSL